MITQKDLASRLGMSVSTVSRALAGSPQIPADTVKRVRALAEKMGYRRYGPASALRTQKTGVLGLAVGDIDNPFFASLAHHVERAAQHLGMSLLIANGQEDAAAQEKIVISMVEQRVDGLLLVPTGSPTAGTRKLVGQVPTVTVDRNLAGAGLDAALVDATVAVRQLASHIAQAGYRHPAILCGPNDTSTGRDRAQLVRTELRKAFPDTALPTAHIPHSPDRAATACRDLIRNTPTDVIIAGGNMIALGALKILNRCSLHIGLATFDDLPWFSAVRPSLTAIGTDVQQLAENAIDLLKRRMDSPDAPALTLWQQATLYPRESTTPCHQLGPARPADTLAWGTHRGRPASNSKPSSQPTRPAGAPKPSTRPLSEKE